MRRLFGLLAIAGLLGVILAVAPNPVTAQPVGACGWNQETFNYDYRDYQYNGGWGRAYFYVYTYNDGCGNRKYQSRVLASPYASDQYMYINIRVWVCGTYKGLWHTEYYTNDLSRYSDVFHYGNCGRQADNYGSSTSSNYEIPNYIQVTVNQG